MKNKVEFPTKIVRVIIAIESLDDIYSDFDLRNINIRSLSEDFVNELIMQSKYCQPDDKIQITLAAPLAIRKKQMTPQNEEITKRRILQYFTNIYKDTFNKLQKQVRHSVLFIGIGLLCFMIFQYSDGLGISSKLLKSLLNLMELGSWFSIWEGINILRHIKNKDQLKHLSSLASADVHFKFVKKF